MKTTFLIYCVLIVALLGGACAPESALEISAGDDTISVTATLIENGVMIENVGDVDCIVTVMSPEDEQWFEVVIGGSVTVTGITEPIEVSAVSG